MKLIHFFGLIIASLAPFLGQAEGLIDIKRTVVCDDVLRELSIPHNSASKAVRCHLQPNQIECLPGLVLKEDGHVQMDVCLNIEGKVVAMPTCKILSPPKYKQKIVQRRRGLVDWTRRKTRQTRRTLVDIPFSTRTEPATLTTTKPLFRPGPDLCVYRLLPTIYGQTKAGRSRVKDRPPVYPVQKLRKRLRPK